jgi:hypothetical protein
MRHRLNSVHPAAWLALGLIWLALGQGRLMAADPRLKFEAQLIWATNDHQSPDPTHKAVDADILKKLQDLPLKWTNYFSVNRRVIEVGATPAKMAMSEKCEIEVKNVGNGSLEVALFGKHEQLVKRTQALPKGETLVLGGNAPNSTAWLVVLKRLE